MNHSIEEIISIVTGEKPCVEMSCFDECYDLSQQFQQFLNNGLVVEGYRSDYCFAGCPQGIYESYSAKIFWQQGNPTYQKKGRCCIPTSTIYISAIAPIAIVIYRDSIFGKGSYLSTGRRGRVAVMEGIGWEGDYTIDSISPTQIWWEFEEQIKQILATNNIKVVSPEVLKHHQIEKFAYFPGLELESPQNLLEALFHGGINYDY